MVRSFSLVITGMNPDAFTDDIRVTILEANVFLLLVEMLKTPDTQMSLAPFLSTLAKHSPSFYSFLLPTVHLLLHSCRGSSMYSQFPQ
jgi:hypothetical protein